MAEQTVPQCTCGNGVEQEGGPKRIIFACAGASKAGQLTNEAAVRLTKEGYGNIACTASLAVSTPTIMKKVEGGAADEVVVIDGCAVGCARQIAERAGVVPDQEIVVTDLGIEKGGSLDLSEEDVETVVSAAWEGRGREKQEQKPEGSGGCGCGCGGSTDTLVVEWRHIGRDIENTCERCGATGRAVMDVVEQIRPILEEEGIAVRFVETVLE
ncbi:MAG: putative zinc-binding protein, partial [Methanoculleus sp.]|nr:putative zinc-binding protein [Methanoculleus sp.]